ncbi:flagellar L-ring protein precursor FlgH [Desulfonatronum thiosulfatophilum]|uniref:Flagellar L-ring protein n=1 Tax=Desulfonatronum thiosulfatophilum TaxID=617002 RepID=A0A1G6DIB7_9BACT|nr:flagellar basal body L-ring protein FlgH [Desulfonatronum thiosulfatophilum]SDB44937.1 flagellar L-ring protein precursor FlgH [Desulfonatronum thiosulfatophilum]
MKKMHKVSRKSKTLVLLALSAMLMASFGCAPARTQSMPAPILTQTVDLPQPAELNPGSLFNPASAELLFADNRARRVGDIVQIKVVEETKAQNRATTDTSRDSSTGMSIEHLLDQRLVNLGLPILGINRDQFGATPLISANSSSSFKGDGETRRESKISATVGARVVQVLPNGLLQVEGARETRVNNETQIVVVHGLIRSTDINPDNTILSTQMADATIEFYGTGILADKQRPGWLTRILDNVWPF